MYSTIFLKLLHDFHAENNPSRSKLPGSILNGIGPSPPISFVHIHSGPEWNPAQMCRDRKPSLYFQIDVNSKPYIVPSSHAEPWPPATTQHCCFLKLVCGCFPACFPIGGQQGLTRKQQKSSGIVGSIFRQLCVIADFSAERLKLSQNNFHKRKYSLCISNSSKICQILHIQSSSEFKHIHGTTFYTFYVYWKQDCLHVFECVYMCSYLNIQHVYGYPISWSG